MFDECVTGSSHRNSLEALAALVREAARLKRRHAGPYLFHVEPPKVETLSQVVTEGPGRGFEENDLAFQLTVVARPRHERRPARGDTPRRAAAHALKTASPTRLQFARKNRIDSWRADAVVCAASGGEG